MLLKQATLDRIRQMNKVFTNRLMIHLCGKGFGHFAILTHTGRKSGRRYPIPVIAEPAGGGFVIALTYGQKVDWLKNVVAAGGCTLCWKKRGYQLVQPRLIGAADALPAFPAIIRAGLRKMGISEFVRLDIQA